MSPILANIFGPDALAIVGVIVLLFGGSQLPRLARSLGSAKSEFEKGQKESTPEQPSTTAIASPKVETPATPVEEQKPSE